jgi:hypothetical protein
MLFLDQVSQNHDLSSVIQVIQILEFQKYCMYKLETVGK